MLSFDTSLISFALFINILNDGRKKLAAEEYIVENLYYFTITGFHDSCFIQESTRNKIDSIWV